MIEDEGNTASSEERRVVFYKRDYASLIIAGVNSNENKTLTGRPSVANESAVRRSERKP